MDDVRAVAKAAAEQVSVPMHVTNLLVDLRTFLQDKVEPPVYVSDRRLVKALALLQVCLYTTALVGSAQELSSSLGLYLEL